MPSVALKLFATQGAWTRGQSGDYIVPPLVSIINEEPDFLWKGIRIIASFDGSAQHRSVYYGDVFLLLKK